MMKTLNLETARTSTRLKVAILAGLMTACAIGPAIAGQSVNRIPFAHTIDDWSMLDTRRVVLHKSPNQHYIVHLKKQCDRLTASGLRYVIGVSSTHNTIRPGFDRIIVDGTWCTIDSIERVNSVELKNLKMAASTRVPSAT
ncbi:MAG: DUF6491 family protein [Pseudomonadota bacterium]